MHKDSFTQALRAHHAIILILRFFLFFFLNSHLSFQQAVAERQITTYYGTKKGL